MARREHEGRARAALTLTICLAAFAAFPRVDAEAAAPVDAAARALTDAQAAYTAGDFRRALELLRALRATYPGSAAIPAAFALSIECSLATGDEYTARYFYQRLHDDFPASPEVFATAADLGRHFYDARAWDTALAYYRAAADAWRVDMGVPRAAMDGALLRAAELSLYHAADEPGARAFLARVRSRSLEGPEALLFRELRVRLLWSVLGPGALGLTDGNVSSLRADGDDLWVGTWNGGVSRFSVSARHADPFPDPAFSRSIEVTDRRVWVGTTDGLAWYGKTTGRWGADDAFGGDSPSMVQVVRRAAGDLYAGTLGAGLFRLTDTGWQPVSDGELPGRYVTTIADDPSRHRLLVGTMSLGVIVLDLLTGSMETLSDIAPGFTSENITTILAGSDGRVWIGTYGEGLISWSPESGSLQRYTKAGGEIGDDWVLCSLETSRGLYFGTFGGGVSFLARGGTWRRIGISDGLASLDVTAIETRPPWVFFGTLGAGVSVYDEASDADQP